MSSIFSKIIAWEIPADVVYEQDDVIVIKDIHPERKTHVLIIPKKEIATIHDMSEADEYILGELLQVAKKVALQLWVQSSYQLRVNVWNMQEVPHIHMHLLSDL